MRTGNESVKKLMYFMCPPFYPILSTDIILSLLVTVEIGSVSGGGDGLGGGNGLIGGGSCDGLGGSDGPVVVVVVMVLWWRWW